MSDEYDVIIIGSGPAGLTAGLYCGRAGLKTMIMEKGNLGGTLVDIDLIENWPGVEDSIMGPELAGNMLGQVMNCGVDVLPATAATGLSETASKRLQISTAEATYCTKTAIITGGTRPRTIGIAGEESLAGHGVHYCVMCDGAAYAGKEIAIVGGGDSGASGALYVTRLGCRVKLFEVLPKLGACHVLKQRMETTDAIEVFCATKIQGIEKQGEKIALQLKDLITEKETQMTVDGVFVLAGRIPLTEYLGGFVTLDDNRFIVVNRWMETSHAGVYAAGDIRSDSAMQIVSAGGDGATAAIAAERYISRMVS